MKIKIFFHKKNRKKYEFFLFFWRPAECRFSKTRKKAKKPVRDLCIRRRTPPELLLFSKPGTFSALNLIGDFLQENPKN